MLNSYGGTFVGLKPVTGNTGKNGNESRVVTIRLGTLKHLSIPKLEKPCKREFFITAVFDTDSLEEIMEHQRNRSVLRQGEFENGYYTCSFNEHTIILPCKGKNFVRLYLSCISTIEENGERKIVLNGLSYTDAYKISKLENYREDKSLTLVSDAAIAVKSNGNNTAMVKQGITGGILSFKIETKPSLGVYIPRDLINSVMDAYKNEGEVYSPSNSNKFDVNKFNSMSNDRAINKYLEKNNAKGNKSDTPSERSINVTEAKKLFDKKTVESVKPPKSTTPSEGAPKIPEPKVEELADKSPSSLNVEGEKAEEPIASEPTAPRDVIPMVEEKQIEKIEDSVETEQISTEMAALEIKDQQNTDRSDKSVKSVL